MMRHKSAFYTPILVLVVCILLAAVEFIPAEKLGLDDNPYFAVVILQLLIYMVPSLFYCRARSVYPGKRFRLPRPGHILLLVYGTLLLISCNALISMGMYRLLPEAFASSMALSDASFAMNSGLFDGAYMVVAFALLPAVTEEFLFRGIVLKEYEQYGTGFAILLSALTFAISHFDFARLPVYLVSGVILALVFYATRSLIAAMLLHAMNNICILLLEKYVLYIAEKQNISMLLLLIFLATVMLVSLILFCGEASAIYRGYGEDAIPVDYARVRGGNRFSNLAVTCFSPTFLILMVFFIVVTCAR